MVRYKFSLCIGQANTDSGITVKCHDDGISFLIKLMVCRQVSKWRTQEEAFTIPEGSKVVLKIAKPDNTKCLIGGTVKAEGVLFKLRPEAFTVAGISEAEVSVYGADGRRATTATFNIDVPEECVCNCEVESGPYVDIIGEQIKAAKEAEAGAKKAAEAAMQAQVNAPKIGDNGNWFVWDFKKGEYVDTGVAASVGGGGSCELPKDVERTTNRTTEIDETSDDEHYPTAKAVHYVLMELARELLEDIIGDNDNLTTDAKLLVDAINELNGEHKNLNTESKRIVDAINEVYGAVCAIVLDLDRTFGNIDTALDEIIALQESYISQSPAPVNEEVAE